MVGPNLSSIEDRFIADHEYPLVYGAGISFQFCSFGVSTVAPRQQSVYHNLDHTVSVTRVVFRSASGGSVAFMLAREFMRSSQARSGVAFIIAAHSGIAAR